MIYRVAKPGANAGSFHFWSRQAMLHRALRSKGGLFSFCDPLFS